MNKLSEAILNFLFPAAQGEIRRRYVRHTLLAILAGLVIAVAFGLILYVLNRQARI
jgi:formate/nitrite transporter FocA (FNT family)